MNIKSLLTIVLCCITISSCDNASDDGTTISGIEETVTINETGQYNLTISGINNTVTVKTDNTINKLIISGINNLLKIEGNTTVKVFEVSGSDNTLYVPNGSGISITDSGAGNSVIEQ